MFWCSQNITKACIVFMCFVVGHKHCVKVSRHFIFVQFKHEYCSLQYIHLIQFLYSTDPHCCTVYTKYM